jgi:NAD-dependent deacetylase
VKNKTNHIVFFSGAGMSAESGISTFRDLGGLWEQYRIEEVATPEAWRNNPEKVQHFYNLRRKQIIECQPNEGHILIAKLEEKFDVTVITQNIDDLHERAGSKHVVHLHGHIRYAKSSGPNPEKKYYPIQGWELLTSHICDDGYVLRPHVVWFGEEVPMLEVAADIINTADIFVVLGTSLNVYPAAGLVHVARNSCQKYLIDPNANELSVPDNFITIPKGAGEGIKDLLKMIE